jgi:hypothetical protein
LVLTEELVPDEISYVRRLPAFQMLGKGRLDYLEDATAKSSRVAVRRRLTSMKSFHLAIAPIGLDVTRRDNGDKQQ